MTLEEFLASIEANVPSLDAINNGDGYDEYTGKLTLDEDAWGAIQVAHINLRDAIKEAKPLFDKWIDADLARLDTTTQEAAE